MPPPEPPSVNEGRMTTGYPPPPAYAAICAMSACTASASSSECARPDNADVKPIRVMACLNQRTARLRSGIIKFAALPDDDRAGADDQNAMQVSAFWHVRKG